MRKCLFLLLVFSCMCSVVHAETAREYTAWLEEVLPDATFADTEIPAFVTKYLGADYDFIARSDAKYGSYIAGVRRDSAPELPEDTHVSGYFIGDTSVFQVQDNDGTIYYSFILGDGVQVSAYDGLEHLIIYIDEAQTRYIPFA
ncbi:MAG: hypothetical protein J6M10_06610, partial [Clostridia bacterium]|nr:hypothetical protein [Clostridia bacterium]